MPVKITEEIRDAIRKAVEDVGSQLAFQRMSGISQRNISRYISSKNLNLSDRMWRDLSPYLKKYLPEGYEPAGLRAPPPGVVLNVQKDYREYLRYCLAILEQDEIPDNIKITLLRQYIESLLT